MKVRYALRAKGVRQGCRSAPLPTSPRVRQAPLSDTRVNPSSFSRVVSRRLAFRIRRQSACLPLLGGASSCLDDLCGGRRDLRSFVCKPSAPCFEYALCSSHQYPGLFIPYTEPRSITPQLADLKLILRPGITRSGFPYCDNLNLRDERTESSENQRVGHTPFGIC